MPRGRKPKAAANFVDIDHKDDVESVDSSIPPSDEMLVDDDQEDNTPASKKLLRQKSNQSHLEQNKALSATLEQQKLKRYAFLLGQTQIFSHFIKDLKKKGVDVSSIETASASTSSSSTQRKRKTEKEEDEELLKDDQGEEVVVETVFDQSPAYVKGGEMRDYQIQGLNWMISLYDNGLNGILADEMGLGKTLQTISFLGYLKVFRNIKGPHIVIVPKSTLQNWVNEFKRWVPEIDVFLFHGMKDERGALIENTLLPMKFDVCVTSYEMCLLEKTHLKKFAWQYLIMDEAHRIKNENSSLSQIVRIFKCRNRLLLTGTPLQNNLHELWALLNFLLPDVFSSSDDFDTWFSSGNGDQETVVQQLQKILRPFLLRRIKADVEHSLLPKKRINLYVGMSEMQRKWYKAILEKDIDAVNGATPGKATTRLQNIVMQLRKCSNHPYLFDGAESTEYTNGEKDANGPHLVENSGKLVILDKLLESLKKAGSRVLLFSQMSRMLDILEDYCYWKGYKYCRIDGNTSHADRIEGIDEFNKPDSEKFIFLLTTRAGGLGINLATADVVVMYDSDWNPQVDLQAEDRAHRIGQKKQVHVFRFITEDSIEEKMIDRASQKLRLDQIVIQQGRAVQQSKAASKDELLSMIQHGASSVFKSTESTISNDSIEEIIKRGESKTQQLDTKYQKMGIDDLQKFTVDGTEKSLWQFEGEDYKKTGGAGRIGFDWIGPGKRERKGLMASMDVEGYYRETLKTSKGPGPRAPRPPKSVHTHDFQFWDPRFVELQNQEILNYRKQQGYKIPKPEKETAAQEEARIQEQTKIEESEPLTAEQQELKESLAKSGFENWKREDYKTFIRLCEKYGRNELGKIANEMDGKTRQEVEEYAKVFWKRIEELAEYEKVLANIEKGEQRLVKVGKVVDALAEKIAMYRSPLQQMKINYGTSKGKNYNEDEDRFLLVSVDKYGYGNDDIYDRIREDIRKSSIFRFDWFIKSRTSAEIQRRCNTLVTLVVKEMDDKTKEKTGGKRKSGSTLGQPATAKKRRSGLKE